MPTFDITGPDGVKYSITGDTAEGALSALQQHLGAQQPGEDALSMARTGAGGLIEGIPVVGPYIRSGIEKAAAGTIAAFSDETYDDVMKRIEKGNAEEKKANPWIDTGSQIAGGVAGTVPMMMAAPGMFGLGSGSTVARMGASIGSGGVLGSADSAVRSGGDGWETLKGGMVGAFGGLVGPAIGRGAGAVVRALRNRSADALSGISPKAANYLETQMADGAKVAAQREALEKLGPEATLADVSPEWLGVARGAAARPGTRDMVVQELKNRQAAANGRLRVDMDANLGPARIPSEIQRGIDEGQDAVGEGYWRVMSGASPVDSRPLAESLDSIVDTLRGPERSAVAKVRSYLDVPGTNDLDTNPSALLATRRTIDGMIGEEKNDQVVRWLTIARNEIDRTLGEAAPGIKDVDAAFHELARQSEGLKQGRPILNNGVEAMRPQELQEKLIAGGQPQGNFVGPSAEAARMRQSTRADIDRAIGTEANDLNALRKTVRGEGDWNREKLALLHGQENADAALSAIDRESVFADTANRVTRGSDTAMGNQFSDFLGEVEQAGRVPSDLSLTSMGIGAIKGAADELLSKNAEKTASRYASDIGRLSIAKGAERDAIIDALLKRSERPQTTADPRLQAVIDAVTRSTMQQMLSR